MERFFSGLRIGLAYPARFPTLQTARTVVFECIEMFYNRQRLRGRLHTYPEDVPYFSSIKLGQFHLGM